MHWRTRRKLTYTIIALLPLALIVGVIYYGVFFPDPTCNDGVQNGSETGIDCGGNCQQICQSRTADVSVLWQESFNVSDDVYNVAASIENPNISLEARAVPYSFKLYDSDNLLITERRGRTFIPPQPSTVIFEDGIVTDGREVSRTTFSFLEQPFWQQSNLTSARFRISNKTLSRQKTNPRLTADVTNATVNDYEDVSLSALVLDRADNVVNVSRTLIGELPAGATESIIFTWRQPFATREISCNIPFDAALLLDRSGSMNNDSQLPPQPLTAVKQAAGNFVDLLGDEARVGLVSFATEATLDQPLADDKNKTAELIEDLFVREVDETGATNIGAAVRDALGTLQANTSMNSNRRQVIILLTDGQANVPEDPGGETYARQQITAAKDAGVIVYTIGLGDEANQTFLSDIATSPDNHFTASSRQQLEDIYTDIHTAICEEAPFITQITPTGYQLAQ